MDMGIEAKKKEKAERLKQWAKEKHDLCMYRMDHPESVKRQRHYRGSIYVCRIGENVGFEQGFSKDMAPRPVLVISSNYHNATSETVIVVPLSTKFKYTFKEGKKVPVIKAQYLLPKTKYPFLRDDSVAKIDKIREVDKSRLLNHIGNISPDDMKMIVRKLIWLVWTVNPVKKPNKKNRPF